MSHVIDVKQNPDGSWTASGGWSLTIVRVTCVTSKKAIVALNLALDAIASKVKS